MIMDYHYAIERELQRRQHRLQKNHPTKASQMERLLANTPNLTYPNPTNLNTTKPTASQSIPTLNTTEDIKEVIRPKAPALNSITTSTQKRLQSNVNTSTTPRGLPCKASCIKPSTSTPPRSDSNTWTKQEVTYSIHRTYKTMTTLHKRKPILIQLGPCVRNNTNQHTRPQKQQIQTNLRRQWRQLKAIPDINNN